MSATDELRRMLDERGIKHFDFSKSGWSQTQWEAPDGNRHFTYETYNNPAKTAKLVISWFPTPEQAIAATLGVPCETCPQMDNPDSFIRHLMGRETYELEELARDMYKAIVMMIVIPGYADAHRSELEAIDDRAHGLGVVSE